MIVFLVGCRDEDPGELLANLDRPATAEGVVLLAQIAADNVTFEGVLDGAPQSVDIDASPDDRYGFRYQVIDDSGAVLYERSTSGPTLVESFLDYYSTLAGINLLDGIPTLGRFPLVVPILPTADHVQVQVRDETGVYVDRGIWSYDHLADPRVQPTVVPTNAVVLRQSTVLPDQSLDIVIVGDGYTADQLDDFAAQADLVVANLEQTEPFASYAPRMSITRLDVVSNESGAWYECPTCDVVDNALGSVFPVELVNRVTGSAYSTRAMFQTDQWLVTGAVASVPWDAVLVMVNSPTYGGLAIHFASVTVGSGDMGAVAVHELGHALGLLGDEYMGDICIRAPGIPVPENVTDSVLNLPWRAWVEPSTLVPTKPGAGVVGAYIGGWNCNGLYKPTESCRMFATAEPLFCVACTELLTRRFMRFGDPALGVSLDGTRVVVDTPLPDTEAVVTADGVEVSRGPATAVPDIPEDAEHVDVAVTWKPATVREDPYGDLRETWSFDRIR